MAIGTPTLDALVRGLADRPALLRLLGALGIAGPDARVPRSAWPAYGIRDPADVRGLAVAGRSGSLDAILLELAADAGPERFAALARSVRGRNPARLYLFAFARCDYDRVGIGVFGLDGEFRQLVIEPAAIRASDLEILEEMRPVEGESGLELAMRYVHALDRSRVTRRFFREFSARRDSIARAWTGLPDDARRERTQLALLFLCRLTFLYFIQRRGALAGDPRYLVRLYGDWASRRRQRGVPPTGFYRHRLVPLFFRSLNRPPERRDADARALGPLPYLNGGLFEPHAIERRFPDCDLPDDEVRGAIEDLLERYRFSPGEARQGDRGDGAADDGLGIDPEILGRVFEELMAPDTRGDTGSFYTPAPVVNRVVKDALVQYIAPSCSTPLARAAVDGRGSELPAGERRAVARRLERVRVLDPACGSGAFLLGALAGLTDALTGVTGAPCGAVRRQIVGRSLHGVDLLDDAALLCSLRLWLALSRDDDDVRPLPNLDRRIRQGDALVDPLDLGSLDAAAVDAAPAFRPLQDAAIRRGLRAVEAAGARYLDSGPEDRAARRHALAEAERRLARHWVEAARAAHGLRLRHLRARALERDLFDERPESARRAEKQATALEERFREVETLARALDEDGALPFFSFGIHFAEGGRGFDVILSNPPWIRAHRWPLRLRRLAARSYEVCRSAGWRAGAELSGAPAGVGGQVDLSMLFVERSLRLLAPGGVLAVLVPAKCFRALYGAAARRILLRDLDLGLIEDHALDQRSIFRADAFAGILVGRRRCDGGGASKSDPVRVRMVRRDAPPLEFLLRQTELPLFTADPDSPWLLAPPDALAALRAMQQAGPPLGRHAGQRVRRGVMTGANEVLLLSRAEPKLGGLARVEAEGYARIRRAGGSARAAGRYRAVVETEAVRPLVRGADVDAFRYRTDGYVVWCHAPDGRPMEPPPRAARYLGRHRQVLEGRQGWRAGLPLGALFRLGAETLGPKVAWHDLSDTVRAVALPPRLRFDGRERELVPLNTLYFLPTPDHERALLLAGLLNSLPVRTFARALAERAKDARFRFFAWTISCLPLPTDWVGRPVADQILAISRAAHHDGGIADAAQERLDRAVAALYGLDDGAMAALRAFDRWLRAAE